MEKRFKKYAEMNPALLTILAVAALEAARRGSRKKVDTEFEIDREPKEFVPFYIMFDQHSGLFSQSPQDKLIAFGPFDKKAADEAYHSLVLFFRHFGSGKQVPKDEKRYPGQYFEFLDTARMWGGEPFYHPYLNIATIRTMSVNKGPNSGKVYSREWVSLLDDNESWNKDVMTHFGFDKWSWSPDFRREGDKFVQTYGERADVPIYPPVLLQTWQNYLLAPIRQRWRFPSYTRWLDGQPQGSPNLYKVNGLEFWTGEDIKIRNDFVKDMVAALKKELKPIPFVQVDAPILTPEDRIYKGYAKNRMFETRDGLVLRPQTTPGSYAVADNLIERGHRLPFVIWQHGKSFRREQKKTRKHMRLKEFYQLEFQIIYEEAHPKIDYRKLIRTVKSIVQDYVGRCRTVKARKTPHYSKKTTDIELSRNKMEIASISERTDFDDGHVIEIAIGTDRIVFNADRKRKKK